MPEIPEIETVKNLLSSKVLGKTIKSITVNRSKALNVSVDEFNKALVNQSIVLVRRRAKQIIISFSSNHSIVIHFMLEGYMRFFYSHEEVSGSPSVLFVLTSGETLACYKINLGYIHLVSTTILEEIPELDGLGPEPLDPAFTVKEFLELLSQRKGMIKPLLMDQQFIAGIGNVYSNEVLFCSGILPTRKVAAIAIEERWLLYDCLQNLLKRAIKTGGVYDEKFSSDDTVTGGFESQLQVAYRTGKPCYRCGKDILTKRVGGRNAFYCPICQT